MPHAIETEVTEQRNKLSDLPRELVEEILSHVSTKALVVASATSKFIHDIAAYLINQRIRHALEVEGYRLIYECYAPINKYNHPYNHCEYIGTRPDDLDAGCRKGQSTFEEDLSPLPKYYTYFLPSAHDASFTNSDSPSLASSIVSLDSGELFTQVCTSACLVKAGPKRGLFESVIPVFENFFRVRREWMDECCEDSEMGGDTDGKVMWVGMGEDIGLKLRVSGKRILEGGNGSDIRARDEEPAVEYRVEYQALVIRTTYLLEMIETSKNRQVHSRTAMMISFGGLA